uniref:Serine/threonine-protein kinase VRK1 (inferred by orthology to a C. elegans protein) n=1 Tax=Anisakis simplex TaxID=6269 RepID=A0A0M3KE40_ANISI
LDAHRGFHPSWRGDLEILAYNIFYWITGSLPWQNVQENSEKVQAAKESFSQNYDREISKLITNACGGYLSKLFAIAYATPYNGKLNYDEIIEIVSAALKTKSAPKVSKKSVIKEAVPKPAISKHETDIKDSNSRQPQQSPVVRKVDKVGVKSKTVTSKKIKSPLSRLSKRNASQHRSPASKSPVIIPGLATWRSPRRKVKVGDSSADRNASSSLSARKRKGQQDATEVPIKQKSPGTDENGSEQIKSSGNQEDSSDKTKSSAKKVQGKPRKSLRKPIVKSPPLNIVPSGRSPEIGEQSALAAIIPGVRNMKHIRRSLSTALLRWQL